MGQDGPSEERPSWGMYSGWPPDLPADPPGLLRALQFCVAGGIVGGSCNSPEAPRAFLKSHWEGGSLEGASVCQTSPGRAAAWPLAEARDGGRGGSCSRAHLAPLRPLFCAGGESTAE